VRFLAVCIALMSPAAAMAQPPPDAEPATTADAQVEETPDEGAPSPEPAERPAMVAPPHAELPAVPPDELWREDEAEETSDMRYPGYVVAGLVTLGAGVGLAIGSVVAAFDGSPKDALGLGALATVAFGTGVPLTLLGATPDHPGASAMAYAGIALATGGALGFGLGGILWATQEAENQENPDYVASIALMGAGGAALVAGVVTWAVGAPTDDEEPRGLEAQLVVGPTHVGLQGRF
jgi:hypothetical protein